MGSELLIRSYNVGCGDCIYVRIPKGKKGDFHMLIDCGTKDTPEALEHAIADIRDNLLPKDDNSNWKRLDLIVVTHFHEDHIKGFDPKYFKNIAVKNIWMTVAMDKKHPQAKRSMALHAFAEQKMRAMNQPGMALSPELRDLVGLYSISNKRAADALRNGNLGEEKVTPIYVWAGRPKKDLNVSIKDAVITVLGPEKDIDGYYMGKEADDSLRGLQDATAKFVGKKDSKTQVLPANISSEEFRTLQSRMLSNGLAFASDDSKLINNTSTVLLIEWKGRRLLFVGDAEWHSDYEVGKKNGSWNVMWEKRKKYLSKPIDFLKVGHHGSFNATPWDPDLPANTGVNQIFNSILPLPKGNKSPTAQCIVSTKRKQYETIPDAKLLTELGKRVSNTRIYKKFLKENKPNFNPDRDIFNYSFMEDYSSPPSPREVGDKGWLDKPQPFRTDFESDNYGSKEWNKKVSFVDVFIKPKTP